MKRLLWLIPVIFLMIISSYFATDQLVYSLEFESIDLESISDGSYHGSYTSKLNSAIVEVHVLNHRITDIEIIEHKTGKGKPAETITEKIVSEQTLEVDVISGATSSSNVLRKAIENALLNKEDQ